MKFELSEEQVKKAREWTNAQMDKAKTKDCTGFRFSYVFTPTTLGDCVKIIDRVTSEELDITDDDF